ncbi:P-loop containing nucleoside triphosphate hydrolase protein [Athelia psychrophila]|uniref:P-loop containing nucleoside triphosphate hydrolase protein n=1 Tax=Athelia psychrophila TaxID=1759441 RepID=A0A167V398_9AGAM|nr:P-loop containing nucleoside triphosphate hydrolase protein [Fibularhizoctonia sp. CBS 109695]
MLISMAPSESNALAKSSPSESASKLADVAATHEIAEAPKSGPARTFKHRTLTGLASIRSTVSSTAEIKPGDSVSAENSSRFGGPVSLLKIFRQLVLKKVKDPPTYDLDPPTKPMLLNIIVCGSVGSGKSSLVNMLIGEDRAETSNTSRQCTTASTPYDVSRSNISPYKIWDTPGFNEADHTGSATTKALIDVYKVTRSRNGVSLLVYCLRGRITAAMINNYKTLMTFCNDRVRIALVVTGLDFVVDKDVWWEENSSAFTEAGLYFNDHACIISVKGAEHHTDAYKQSCEAVYSMIDRSIRTHETPWMAEAQAGAAGHKLAGGFGLLFARGPPGPGSRVLYRGLINNGLTKDAALEATRAYGVYSSQEDIDLRPTL